MEGRIDCGWRNEGKVMKKQYEEVIQYQDLKKRHPVSVQLCSEKEGWREERKIGRSAYKWRG